MPSETPHLTKLAMQLERIIGRLEEGDLQVRGLVTCPTVEARRFVVRDERGMIRARLEMEEHAPCITFYDPLGNESLKVGLRTDSTPRLRVEQWELPFE